MKRLSIDSLSHLIRSFFAGIEILRLLAWSRKLLMCLSTYKQVNNLFINLNGLYGSKEIERSDERIKKAYSGNCSPYRHTIPLAVNSKTEHLERHTYF